MIIVIKKRHWIIALLCAAVLIAAPVTAMSTAKKVDSKITNWGLSFKADGQRPTGNATAEELAAYNAYYLGADEKVIYLTFDAGFENGHTPAILDALKKHNAPAAFFLVGNYLETAPDLVRRMVEEGHTVANHTYHHPDMSAIATKEAFLAELTATEEAFREITGQDMPKLYRPPQGKYSEQNLQFANELGYTTVFWSLAYVDWYQNDQPTKDEAFGKLIPRIHNGAIVLLHSTSSTNAAVLDELLSRYEAMGYRFGNLTELTA
jgi:peptidoglycan-N-acetylmuramic acid deacetylase